MRTNRRSRRQTRAIGARPYLRVRRRAVDGRRVARLAVERLAVVRARDVVREAVVRRRAAGRARVVVRDAVRDAAFGRAVLRDAVVRRAVLRAAGLVVLAAGLRAAGFLAAVDREAVDLAREVVDRAAVLRVLDAAVRLDDALLLLATLVGICLPPFSCGACRPLKTVRSSR